MSAQRTPEPVVRIVGRYALFDAFAEGGMATVHFGRALGAAGFSRAVAIKRLKAHVCTDADLASMLVDEARICSRVRHTNVVPTLDIVEDTGELFLVMDYVEGESLAQLLRTTALAPSASERKSAVVPLEIAIAIVAGALRGLHAAHEARSERGRALGIVHRDVSPQNILVGIDGVARVADFGIAKAAGRLQTTIAGKVKGKIAYMAPEQLEGGTVDRRTDVYAASAVLWEALAGERLFGRGRSVLEVSEAILGGRLPPFPSLSDMPDSLADVVTRGLARDPALRYPTAAAMADALEALGRTASAGVVAAWVGARAGDRLEARARGLAVVEDASAVLPTFAPSASGAFPAVDTSPTNEVSRNVEPRPSKRRPLVAAVVFAVFAFLAVVVWASQRHGAGERQAEAAPLRPASVASAAPAPEPKAASVAPEPTKTVIPSAPSAPPSPVARAIKPPPPARPTTRDCTVPFTVDERGVKIPIRECLR